MNPMVIVALAANKSLGGPAAALSLASASSATAWYERERRRERDFDFFAATSDILGRKL